MKTLKISTILLISTFALTIAACGEATEPSNPNPGDNTTTTTTTTTTTAPPPNDPIIWAEGVWRERDEVNNRYIGVLYEETDLSTRKSPYVSFWKETELIHNVELINDITSLVKPFKTRDETISIGNSFSKAIEKAGYRGYNRDTGIYEIIYELIKVTHDSNQDIWILSFGMNNLDNWGTWVNVVINSEKGELLHIWVE